MRPANDALASSHGLGDWLKADDWPLVGRSWTGARSAAERAVTLVAADERMGSSGATARNARDDNANRYGY